MSFVKSNSIIQIFILNPFDDDKNVGLNIIKECFNLFKEALATILTKKITCFGNW